MLEPNQFEEDEAWVVFQLNDAPVRTEQDGDFNCIALMDAASGFIFGTAFVSVAQAEPSVFEVRKLFSSCLERSGGTPATLLLPKGQFQIGRASCRDSVEMWGARAPVRRSSRGVSGSAES